jgi:hypothetical protein
VDLISYAVFTKEVEEKFEMQICHTTLHYLIILRELCYAFTGMQVLACAVYMPV